MPPRRGPSARMSRSATPNADARHADRVEDGFASALFLEEREDSFDHEIKNPPRDQDSLSYAGYRARGRPPSPETLKGGWAWFACLQTIGWMSFR